MDKLEKMRRIGRPRCTCTWEGTIKIDLEEIGWEAVELILLGQDREITGGLLGKKRLVNFRTVP